MNALTLPTPTADATFRQYALRRGDGIDRLDLSVHTRRRLAGLMVGSRAMTGDLSRFVEDKRLRPVIDRVFPFARARDAYRHLAQGRHFGKVVIVG